MPDRERDARVEELLLSGLDHYFEGRLELAINVWTRVLFIDRGHARARAYIERARSALAEHQREGDELFHTGAAALQRGDREAARELLQSAVERGTSGEEALALLHRLDRLDAAEPDAVNGRRPRSSAPPDGADDVPASTRRDPRVLWLAGGLIGGVLLAAVAAGYLWVVADPFDYGPARLAAPPVVDELLPVPSPGEIRILRARGLAAKGQLREALAVLEAGPIDERHRAGADELRARIQRRLLDAARQAGTAGSASEAPFPQGTGSGRPPESPDETSPPR